MKRRVFLSTLVWGAATLVVRPLEAMPPPFDMVRGRISKRASKRPPSKLTVTSMGESIASWEGKLLRGEKTPEFEHEKHGTLRLSPEAPTPMTPGFQLLSALLTEDPIETVETVFGGIRHAKNRLESHQDNSLAYRFGETPSIVVLRESWLLLEVDVGERDGHRWISHLSYRPEEEHPYMIRITRDRRPAVTARLTY